MADSSEFIDFFKLNVSFDSAHPDITIQTTLTSNRSKGVRQEQIKTRWNKVKRIGRGNFGEVWLEKDEGSPPDVRAVKRIAKGGGTNMSIMTMDYHRELHALGKLSRVRISHQSRIGTKKC